MMFRALRLDSGLRVKERLLKCLFSYVRVYSKFLTVFRPFHGFIVDNLAVAGAWVLHCFVPAGMGALLFVIWLAVLGRGGSSETVSRVIAV